MLRISRWSRLHALPSHVDSSHVELRVHFLLLDDDILLLDRSNIIFRLDIRRDGRLDIEAARAQLLGEILDLPLEALQSSTLR